MMKNNCKNCEYLHENGNCMKHGGFFSSVFAKDCPKLGEFMNDFDYELEAVMHAVDKWLEGDELKQTPANRAATMRHKTLGIVEALQKENEELKSRLEYLDVCPYCFASTLNKEGFCYNCGGKS